MTKWVCLAIGCLTGGFARYFLAGAVQKKFPSVFPFGTVAVNLSGCFLIGLINALAELKIPLGLESRLLLVTGFCGAFTTFSAYILESINLIKGGQIVIAGANVVGSVVFGYLAFILGGALVRLF